MTAAGTAKDTRRVVPVTLIGMRYMNKDTTVGCVEWSNETNWTVR